MPNRTTSAEEHKPTRRLEALLVSGSCPCLPWLQSSSSLPLRAAGVLPPRRGGGTKRGSPWPRRLLPCARHACAPARSAPLLPAPPCPGPAVLTACSPSPRLPRRSKRLRALPDSSGQSAPAARTPGGASPYPLTGGH